MWYIYASSEILHYLILSPTSLQQNSQITYICPTCEFVCMSTCFHSCLYSRDLWFWHLKMWAIKTKPPPISSGSGVQNKGTHWRGDYTGEAEQWCYTDALATEAAEQCLNLKTQQKGGVLWPLIQIITGDEWIKSSQMLPYRLVCLTIITYVFVA